MNRFKFKIVTVFVFLVLTLAGFWTSTQMVASYFKYHSMLGSPWFNFNGTPVYTPWAFMRWMLRFQARYPSAFSWQTLPALLSVIFNTFLVVIIGRLALKRREAGLTAHGSARWAGNSDIQKAGLLADGGVVLGLTREKSKYLRHNGPEHICVFAPTRSGKGVGLVVPTLLSWEGSVVCFDPKGENWRITSGFRSKFSRCIYFDPTSLRSARFNPLNEVRIGPNEVKDAQNIADILVDPEGKERRQTHWERTAHALLVGAILHVVYSEKDKTLGGLSEFLANPQRTIHQTLDLMLNTKHLGDQPHPVIASSARELLNKAHEELSGVVSTAVSFLSLYRDPIVAHVTGASDFKVKDLQKDGELVSLYFVVPPSDLSRTKPLIRLMLNQIGRILTESLEERADGNRLLLLLDEFPLLGRLDFFESALAFIAGYRIKAFLITQSLNQIDSIYGQNNSILDNCHVRIAFATNDERSAKRISELVGSKTALKEQESFSGGPGALFFSNRSVSVSEYARPLLTAAEVNQLSHDVQIIFVAGAPPILAAKLRYFEDKNFTERVIEPVKLKEPDVVEHPRPTETRSELPEDMEEFSRAPHLSQSNRLNMRGGSL